MHAVIGPTDSAAPVVASLRRANPSARITRVSAAGDLYGLTASPNLTLHLTPGFHRLDEWSAMSHRVTYLAGEGANLEVHR